MFAFCGPAMHVCMCAITAKGTTPTNIHCQGSRCITNHCHINESSKHLHQLPAQCSGQKQDNNRDTIRLSRASNVATRPKCNACCCAKPKEAAPPHTQLRTQNSHRQALRECDGRKRSTSAFVGERVSVRIRRRRRSRRRRRGRSKQASKRERKTEQDEVIHSLFFFPTTTTTKPTHIVQAVCWTLDVAPRKIQHCTNSKHCAHGGAPVLDGFA